MMGSSSPLVGLSLRCFPKESYRNEALAKFGAAMPSFLAAVRADHGVRFRFFPFYEASAWPDRRALEDVMARRRDVDLPVETVRWENHADLRRQIAACHAFIGVRFHSVLLAVQAGVPVLAISYAEKTANFMTENGLGRFVIRYEDVTAEGLLERWRRLWRERTTLKAELAGICAMQKAVAERHFDLIFEAIGKPRARCSAGRF